MNKYYNKCLFFDRYRDISINICSVTLIILFILFLLLSTLIRINFSKSYSGYVVREDDFYVRVFLDDNDIQFLQKNELVVDGQKLDYSVIDISGEYVLNNTRAVLLSFDLSDDNKIVNNVIRLNFLEKNTVFNKIKEMFL